MAEQRENDIALLLAAQSQLGTKNCTSKMERYVHARRPDGIYVINLGKTYEKLQLAARVIVAIENPQDVVAISARPYGQRGVLKFANYIGARSTVGRHTPGAFNAEPWRRGCGRKTRGESGLGLVLAWGHRVRGWRGWWRPGLQRRWMRNAWPTPWHGSRCMNTCSAAGCSREARHAEWNEDALLALT